MKNKKMISLTMAVSSVATMAVPAFAAEKAVVTPGTKTIDEYIARGKEYKVVTEPNLTEFLRANKSKNPKVVVKKTLTDDSVVYGVELDMEETPTNLQAKANAMVALEKAKSDLDALKKDTYTLNGKEVPKYKVEERDITFDIEGQDVVLAKKIVTLTDLENKDSIPAYTYTFRGVEGEYQEILAQKTKEIVVTDNGNALTDNLKELSKIVYKLEQAKAKGKIYTTTTHDKSDSIFTINVFLKDQKTKVGEIKLRAYNEKVVEKAFIRIPAVNDFTGHWAEDVIIDAMLDKKVDVSSKFRVKDDITRAEFAQMIYGVNGHQHTTEKESFSDVKKTDWYYEAVAFLSQNNILSGYPDGTFRPNQTITRQEAAVMISRLTGDKETFKIDVNGNRVDNIVKTKFEDTKDIAAWADESVKFLQNQTVTENGKQVNIINGYKENGKDYFKPANKITRVEALCMITRENLLP